MIRDRALVNDALPTSNFYWSVNLGGDTSDDERRRFGVNPSRRHSSTAHKIANIARGNRTPIGRLQCNRNVATCVTCR